MNRFLLIGTFCLALIFGVFIYQHKLISSAAPIIPSSLPQILTTPSPSPSTVVGTPQRIVINKIGVDSTIESVGLDSQGKMDVPKHAADTGWYDLGVKPGQLGNAVIDGHLDDVSGAPAVFWNLNKLSPGDQIQVTDDQNKTYTFIVTDRQSYSFDQVPLTDVFGPTNKTRLNLITCEGVFNRAARNYSQRVVVYSELRS